MCIHAVAIWTGSLRLRSLKPLRPAPTIKDRPRLPSHSSRLPPQRTLDSPLVILTHRSSVLARVCLARLDFTVLFCAAENNSELRPLRLRASFYSELERPLFSAFGRGADRWAIKVYGRVPWCVTFPHLIAMSWPALEYDWRTGRAD